MWFEGIAYAQAAGGSSGASGTSEQVLFTTVIPLAFLFAIFYFVLIRPQTRKASEHAKVLAALKRNDEVVTTGGIIGRIAELSDKVVTLEIAPGLRIRVERAQIAGLSAHGKMPKSGGKEKED